MDRTGTRFATLEELAARVARDAPLYLRYAEDPTQSSSCDLESGLPLPGVSVNPLQPESWWTRPVDEWLARQICNYVHLQDHAPERTAWVLAGRIVARGPDNEPLIRDVEVVGWLDRSVVDAARDRYEQAFRVGRDSLEEEAD